MTPINWPASLPCLRWEPYGVAPRPGSFEETLGMVTNLSRIYTQNNEVVSAEVVLNSSQESAFRTFYKTTLSMGTQWFNAPILRNGSVSLHEVMFLGAPPVFTPIAHNVVKASFTLLTRGDSVICETVIEVNSIFEYQSASNTVPVDPENPVIPTIGYTEAEAPFGFDAPASAYVPPYPIVTYWAPNTGLWLRKTFTILQGGTLHISGTVENAGFVYLDGVLVTTSNPSNDQINGDTPFSVSVSIEAGEHQIAMLCLDEAADFGDADNTFVYLTATLCPL